MRILAIRGCNLASLAGEFEIDLAHGVLGGAGVFAIVGPTGAGKSTLLDAMCVALFDRTPRLTNRSTVIIGRGDDDPAALGAQDVRTLLRRGASAGYAEVDFESGDARRYRARWSVRRARGATDGRFQNQQVTLTAIEGGEQLGGTKTETLEAIHQRLGLSFDQFRRSALLAQGEFATFLRADGKDRSELLERMTGTEIYSKLSVAAHIKATLADQRLRERQATALAIAVLTDEARVMTEGELAIAKQAQQASRVRLGAAEAAARWLAEADRRQRAFADADAARAAADLAVDNAIAERAELGLRRRAEALRPTWDEAARLDRQLAIVRGEAATATDAAAQATTAFGEITARRTRLAELHAPVREARIAAGLVERMAGQGRTSSSLIAAAAKATHASSTRTVDPALEQSAAKATHASSTRTVDPTLELEARARDAGADAAWLLARRDLVDAVAGWRVLDNKLALHATLATEITTADRALDEHAQRRKTLAKQRATEAKEHQQANARLAEAQREAAGYQQRRGLSLDAARRQEDEARQRCTELERLVALAGEARGASTARAELERQLGELATATTTDTEHRRIAELERDTAATLRAERTRVIDDLRRAAGYEHARAELVDGDPCPLCGAEEHPWAERGSFDALIGDAQARLVEATTRGEAAVAALATAAAREQHRATDRARLLSCRATAATSASAAQITWREQLAALGELLFVDDPGSPAAQQLAEERAEAARAKLEAARLARSQAEAVAKAGADAQARVQARQTDVEHHTTKLRDLDAALAALDVAVERLRGERSGKLERELELLLAIDDAFASWLDAGGELSAGERRALDQARQLLAALPRPTAGTTPPIDTRAPAPIETREPAPSKRGKQPTTPPRDEAPIFTLAPDAPAILDRCRRVLADLAASWATHAEVVADVDAALVAALLALETVLRDAERIVAEQAARRDAALTRREALRTELAEAASRLDIARLAAGFDRDELQRLLTADASRVDAIAEQLEALDRAADRARTLVAERRRLVEDHAVTSPFGEAARDTSTRRIDEHTSLTDARGVDVTTALLADACRVDELASLTDARRVDDLAAAVTHADHQAAALAAALAADDDARKRRTAALAAFAAAEHEAEIDRVLGQVIGSHDGKLFRSFAQSLTLDGLLAVANSHLEELAPRYQLERVPKHDLELQVIDRDLGNEARSVQSLSGGESFLVSLALALGLSSMSAHDVRVRTLLIDEGFGTLDPATLDSALAVLDALQATGRQVGVISHVPALVERVGAHVRVSPRGAGRSEVVVAEA